MEEIILGISSCLLGNPVRYDGGHKLDRFLRDSLGRFVGYLPICPEAECGMGIPREAMRLEGSSAAPRLMTRFTHADKTDRMLRFAKERVASLQEENLCGFIFKSNSPSCGMEKVKIYGDRDAPAPAGVGLFARIMMEHFPLLPVEEEGRLDDAALRENFIERLFTLRRWRAIRNVQSGRGDLVNFHTRHKLLLLSHSTTLYREMGKLVAGQNDLAVPDLFMRYERLLQEALKQKSTPQKHANVLQHMMGYFKKRLSSAQKEELCNVIDSYRLGRVSLTVPLTHINLYVRTYDDAYLREQIYLNPEPLEQQLRLLSVR